MLHSLGVKNSIILAFLCSSAPSAFAQSASDASGVNPGRHRASAELSGFAKFDDNDTGLGAGLGPGVGLGLGYGYRLLPGLELGGGFRYFVQPSRTTDVRVAQLAPSPGMPAPPPQYWVEPAFRLWLLSASARGYFSLGANDRFEAGLIARVGMLGHSGRAGVCCAEVALAPGFRVRILPGTALALSPELAIATTGADQTQSDDHQANVFFGYVSVWLSVVQTL